MATDSKVRQWFLDRYQTEFYATRLEGLAGTWVAYKFLFASRFELEVVDVGYDCSTYARHSPDAFSMDDYQTVHEFLEELNGENVPTFESGMGMAAESLDTELDHQISAWTGEWFQETLAAIIQNPEPYPVWLTAFVTDPGFDDFEFYSGDVTDDIFDRGLGGINFVATFGEKPLADVVATYREGALAQHREALQQEEARQKVEDLKRFIAGSIDELIGPDLADQPNFEMKNQRALFNLLDAFRQREPHITLEDFQVYLHSPYFLRHVSHKLAAVTQKKYQ